MYIKIMFIIVALFTLGTISFGIPDGIFNQVDVDSNGNPVTLSQTYDSMNTLNPTQSFGVLSKFGTMLSWNYSVFKNADGTDSGWAIIRYLILMPLSLAIVLVLAVTILWGLATLTKSFFG